MSNKRQVAATFIDGQADDPIGAALRVTYEIEGNEYGDLTRLMLELSRIPYEMPSDPADVPTVKPPSLGMRVVRWCKQGRQRPRQAPNRP
jgi:hypothetical protein